MANGCRCKGAREEWRGGAGRQRKKESLFKDGEIPGATTEGGGGGGRLREAWPRLHQRTESSSVSLTHSTGLAEDLHRSL